MSQNIKNIVVKFQGLKEVFFPPFIPLLKKKKKLLKGNIPEPQKGISCLTEKNLPNYMSNWLKKKFQTYAIKSCDFQVYKEKLFQAEGLNCYYVSEPAYTLMLTLPFFHCNWIPNYSSGKKLPRTKETFPSCLFSCLAFVFQAGMSL